MDVISHNEQDTEALGQKIAGFLKSGDILCLSGDLGSGKSVLCRAIIRALCNNDKLEVPSPTFTLVQTYDTPHATLWHFDLYRIEDAEELYEIGWEEALADGIILIEWPERLEFLAPEDRLDIIFRQQQNQQRQISLMPQGSWHDRTLL